MSYYDPKNATLPPLEHFTQDWNGFADRFNAFQEKWQNEGMDLESIADWLCDFQSDLDNMTWKISLKWYGSGR